MYLPFQYYDPNTLQEFFDIVQKFPCKIFAGGTDLLVKMRNGWQTYPHIIDIKKIKDAPQLYEIRPTTDGTYIGALVNFTTLKNSQHILEKYTALQQATSVMGCYEIRNRATIGGNICNASSGSESGSPLLMFNAQVHILSPNGERTLPLDQFYGLIPQDNGKTKPGVHLQPYEILTHIFLPALPDKAQSIYLRRARTQGMDLASLNLAMVHYKTDNTHHFRIAGGAVSPLPTRFPEIEAKLQQSTLQPHEIQQIKQDLQNTINPRPGSKRATVQYKKDQIGELFQTALTTFNIT